MDELRNRATKFIQIEELINYHRSNQSEGTDKGKTKEIDLYQVDPTVSEKIEDPDFFVTHH